LNKGLRLFLDPRKNPKQSGIERTESVDQSYRVLRHTSQAAGTVVKSLCMSHTRFRVLKALHNSQNLSMASKGEKLWVAISLATWLAADRTEGSASNCFILFSPRFE